MVIALAAYLGAERKIACLKCVQYSVYQKIQNSCGSALKEIYEYICMISHIPDRYHLFSFFPELAQGSLPDER